MEHPDIEYKTTVEDEHWRSEEFQWARILAQGHPARGNRVERKSAQPQRAIAGAGKDLKSFSASSSFS